jgi:multisubunit Na+/H+ antiporter MnhC subunit
MEILKKIFAIIVFLTGIALIIALFAYFNLQVIPELQFNKYQTEIGKTTILDTVVNVDADLKTLNG